MTVPDPMSPDCETKKHTACSGDAWDKLRDEPAPCTCACHGRPRFARAVFGKPLTATDLLEVLGPPLP